jgi:hypothetical protein
MNNGVFVPDIKVFFDYPERFTMTDWLPRKREPILAAGFVTAAVSGIRMPDLLILLTMHNCSFLNE